MYTGPLAAHSFYNLAIDGKPDTVVLLGLTILAMGAAFTYAGRCLANAVGEVEIDSALQMRFFGNNVLDVDNVAHKFEHSLEVQLPFLQYLYGDIQDCADLLFTAGLRFRSRDRQGIN